MSLAASVLGDEGHLKTFQESEAADIAADILAELEQAFDLHAAAGSRLAGVHFELTGENVTECIGGARGLAAEELERDYRSQVDPRLNYEQSLELAIRLAARMSAEA